MKPQKRSMFLAWPWSPPTRGAWIETPAAVSESDSAAVAPHAGGVD